MKNEVAIGMSVGRRNVDKAIETAQKLSLVSTITCLLFESEEPRKALPIRAAQLGKWKEVWLWDAGWTEIVLDTWPASLPLPFYGKISYGGNINHLLILLALIGRSYLVRLDPGTWPLEDPALFVARHYSGVTAGRIVSGQYSDRIALRDDFISEGKEEDYYRLIERYSKVDPRKGQQLTGGANLLRPAGMKPDIAFNGVMAWASDDGFLQRFYGNEAEVDPLSVVGRKTGGYPQGCDEYVRRLVNAVVLHQVHSGGTNRDEILDAVRAFLNELKVLAKEERVADIESIDVDATPIEHILSGYENHTRLTAQWPAVVAEATRRLRAASVSQLD